MADSAWEGYIKKYGAEPQNVSHLQSFSINSADYKALSFKDARELFNRNKGKKTTAKKQKTEEKKSNEKQKIFIPDGLVDSVLDEIDEKEESKTTIIKRKHMTSSQQNEFGKRVDALITSKSIDDEKEVLLMIISGEIDVISDYDWVCRNVWIPACRTGKKSVIQALLNLNSEIINYENRYSASSTSSGLDYCRMMQHFDCVELLILEKLGAGKANEIIKECNHIFDEDGILSAFINELNLLKNADIIKQGLVNIITNMIKKRNPISSILTNIGMMLNCKATWNCIQDVSNAIISDTNDKIGWHYLNNYLTNNNSFIFRKYPIPMTDKVNDDNKEESAALDTMLSAMGFRPIQSLTSQEIAYLIKNVAKDEYNNSEFTKMGVPADLSDEDVDKINNVIISEQIDGKKFVSLTKEDVKGLISDLTPMVQVMFANFLFKARSGKGFIEKYALVPIALVPVVTEGRYPFDALKTMCQSESEIAANKDIKEYFIEEEKINYENWIFLKNYAKQMSGNNEAKRLRQDSSLKYGVKSEYNKIDMINMMGVTSFNPIRYYDFEIYLNKLMFRNAMLDEPFQNQCKLIFGGIEYVDYKRGPLKKIQRCKVKTETDYFNQEFPTSACLLDIVRCTVTFKDIQSMIDTIKKFENLVNSGKAGCIKEIMRIKNGFAEYDHQNPQYTDIKYNVRINVKNEEVVAEIQFLLQNMAEFKIKAHKYYNVIRKEEYFDNLMSIITIKNSIEKKVGVLIANNDYRGLMSVMINENVKNLNDLTGLSGFKDWMNRIYELGRLKCIKAILSIIYIDDIAQFIQLQYTKKELNGFYILCANGHDKCAKYLLNQLPDHTMRQKMILFKNKGGDTALIKAINEGHFKVVKYLYNLIQDEKLKINSIIEGFQAAAKNGHVDVVRFIWENLKDKDSKISAVQHNKSILIDICQLHNKDKQQFEICQFLLSELVSLNAIDILKDMMCFVNQYKQSALKSCCQRCNIKMVKLLLSFIRDDEKLLNQSLVEMKDGEGKNVFMASCRNDENIEICKALINDIKNMDKRMEMIMMQDNEGNTVLMNEWLTIKRCTFILNEIKNEALRSKMIMMKNKKEESAFTIAAKRKNNAVCEYLLSLVKDETEKQKMKQFQSSCK